MKKRKILHIPTGGLFSDGIGTFINSYSEYMNLDEWDITILATNNPASEDRKRFTDLGLTVVQILRQKKTLLVYMKRLYKLLREKEYEIVHVHGSSALMSVELLVAKLAGVPVRIAHSHNTTCDHLKIDRALRPIFYRLYNVAWACGQGAGQWLFDNHNFEIVHNARDVKKYKFDSSERAVFRGYHSLSDTTIALGHVGRFNEQKNQKFLINLMEKLENQNLDVRLFLVGLGDNLSQMKQLVIDKGLEKKVIFLGQMDDMKSFVSGMDLMLLPSLYEGLPLVSVEWQLNGVPSLLSNRITDECIFSEIVSQLPLENVAEWEDKIINLVREDRNARSVKNISLARDEGYDIVHEVRKLEKMYQEELGKK